MSQRKRIFIIMTALLLLLTACSSGAQVMDGDGMVRSYTQISQDEAKEMMEQDDGHVIVDVRRPDEFAAGHIPGAICIPNETIESAATAASRLHRSFLIWVIPMSMSSAGSMTGPGKSLRRRRCL